VSTGAARGAEAPVWRCPRCGYSLAGVVREGRARCPECARETGEPEQAAMMRAREMPRELGRIAQFGVVFTVLVLGWSVVGGLGAWWTEKDARVFVLAAAVSAAAAPGSVWVWRRLASLHARHEVAAWVAAHATWAAPIVGVAMLRWA
jgi:hypothetical protein